jgi:hypothetical protein
MSFVILDPPVPLTRYRSDLPPAPHHIDDIPAGDTLLRGVLVVYHSPHSGRPYVGLRVECSHCRQPHVFPWKWRWGLDPDGTVLVRGKCYRGPREPHWIALDPDRAGENLRTHTQARAAFLEWFAAKRLERAAARAARSARRAARLRWIAEMAGESLAPLWAAPVGTQPLTAG